MLSYRLSITTDYKTSGISISRSKGSGGIVLDPDLFSLCLFSVLHTVRVVVSNVNVLNATAPVHPYCIRIARYETTTFPPRALSFLSSTYVSLEIGVYSTIFLALGPTSPPSFCTTGCMYFLARFGSAKQASGGSLA